MTGPAGVGWPVQPVLAAPSGEEGQREGSDADDKGQQRRDGVPDMGGALTRWSALVPKPLAAEDSGQQQRAAGDEHRDGVGHGRMLADSGLRLLGSGPEGRP
jgi:hypothetical protein